MVKVEYEADNAPTIPQEGEQIFNAFTLPGQDKKMVVQICEVNQCLMGVSKVVKAGHRAVFDNEWSYIKIQKGCERTLLAEKGGTCILKMGVRRLFERQGQWIFVRAL